MTRKVYKSAMGKTVDLGSLILQNEHVRAVGNMNVNARGDVLDSSNKVIDQKNRATQRQYRKTTSTNVTADSPVHTSNVTAKQAKNQKEVPTAKPVVEENNPLEILDAPPPAPVESVPAPKAVQEEEIPAVGGGLAAAIARSRLIKQEKEKTLKEKQQAQGLRKI